MDKAKQASLPNVHSSLPCVLYMMRIQNQMQALQVVYFGYYAYMDTIGTPVKR